MQDGVAQRCLLETARTTQSHPDGDMTFSALEVGCSHDPGASRYSNLVRLRHVYETADGSLSPTKKSRRIGRRRWG